MHFPAVHQSYLSSLSDTEVLVNMRWQETTEFECMLGQLVA